MAGILRPVNTELSSNGIRGICFGRETICRPEQCPPFFYGILADELHANGEIARHELDKPIKERLTLMFGVETFGIGHPHPEHFDVANLELLLRERNDLAYV